MLRCVNRLMVLFLFSGILFSITCFSADKQTNGEKRENLKVGMLNLMAGAVTQLAFEQGFYTDNNINLKIVSFQTAQQIAIAVGTGDIDIGQSGLTAAVYNLATKGLLKVIAGASREMKDWRGVAYMVSNKQWDKGLHKPSQLQNISLAITEKGSTLHYMAGLLADKYAFSLDEKITLVPMGTLSSLQTALASSQIDSAIIPGVIAHKLESDKHGHIIGYVGDETPWQLTAVFASSKILNNNPALVKKYLTAFVQGCKFYHRLFNTSKPELYTTPQTLAKWPERKKAATIIAQFVKPTLDPIQVSQFPVYMDAEGKIDTHSIHHQINWYKSKNMIDQKTTIDQVLDLELIKAL